MILKTKFDDVPYIAIILHAQRPKISCYPNSLRVKKKLNANFFVHFNMLKKINVMFRWI